MRTGLTTFDDVRFLRLVWEVPKVLAGQDKKWQYFSKGGDYAKYYTDIHLAVNRAKGGAELAEVNRKLNGQVAQSRQGSSYYYRPGLTFTSRSGRGFSVRALPGGCVISHNAPTIYPASGIANGYLLGWINSRLIHELIEMQASADYFTPGSVKVLPWQHPTPDAQVDVEKRVRDLAHRYGFLSASIETSPNFVSMLPSESSLSAAYAANEQRLVDLKTTITELQTSLSDAVDDVYSINSRSLKNELLESDPDIDVPLEALDLSGVADGVVSWLVGYTFGRWRMRHVMGEQLAPELPDPFAPLPVCPPGQLQNAEGLPARPEDVPEDYPIQIPWDGLLVDDPGHALDIERRVREVIEIIWGAESRQRAVGSGQIEDGSKEEAVAETAYCIPPTADSSSATPESIEQEACEILGVRSLREYFQKPAKFFADHLKRYSKSRRQAPIYWPLSTESGGYTLWIYYHRLTDQTLFHAVNNFVEPKLKQVTEQLSRLKAKSGRSSAEEKELSTLTVLESELTDFRDELLLVAKFWKPNLNDGVLITASPLWKLFRLPKWRKDLKACWDELDNGEYDWAHLALSIWPDRVVRTAHKDRSIAIAHDLESDLWHEVTVTKPGKGKNAKPTTKIEWQPKKLSEAELDKIAKRKT